MITFLRITVRILIIYVRDCLWNEKMPISWGSWVEENFYFDFFRKKAHFYHFSPDITAECTFYNLLSLFLIRPIYADLENLISANKLPYLLIFCLKMIKYPIFKGKIRFWYFIHPPISWKSSIYTFSDNPGHNVLRILLNLHWNIQVPFITKSHTFGFPFAAM